VSRWRSQRELHGHFVARSVSMGVGRNSGEPAHSGRPYGLRLLGLPHLKRPTQAKPEIPQMFGSILALLGDRNADCWKYPLNISQLSKKMVGVRVRYPRAP